MVECARRHDPHRHVRSAHRGTGGPGVRQLRSGLVMAAIAASIIACGSDSSAASVRTGWRWW
jgi:hypothetical protein